jgi:hypothetical protein
MPCHQPFQAWAALATLPGIMFILSVIHNAIDAEYFRCILADIVIHKSIDFCGP